MPNTNDYPLGTSQVPKRRLIVAGRLSKTTPVRVLRTPPVQNDLERGEGESTNARLHRLLAPREKK